MHPKYRLQMLSLVWNCKGLHLKHLPLHYFFLQAWPLTFAKIEFGFDKRDSIMWLGLQKWIRQLGPLSTRMGITDRE